MSENYIILSDCEKDRWCELENLVARRLMIVGDDDDDHL